MSAAVAARRRTRVVPQYDDKSAEDVRAMLTRDKWRGIPNSFVGYLPWICKGLAENQVILLVETATAGLGTKRPEWTGPLPAADLEKASPFSDTMMFAAVERLIGVGAMERKCECGAGQQCANQGQDHYRYRLRYDQWERIVAEVQAQAKLEVVPSRKDEEKAATRPSTLVRVETGKMLKFASARYEMPDATPAKAVDFVRLEGASDDVVGKLDADGTMQITLRPSLVAAKDRVSAVTPEASSSGRKEGAERSQSHQDGKRNGAPGLAAPDAPASTPSPLAPIIDALLAAGLVPDDDGVAALFADCRKERPDATPEETAFFITQKAERANKGHNPFGVLRSVVPACFRGESFPRVRAKLEAEARANRERSERNLTAAEKDHPIRVTEPSPRETELRNQLIELSRKLQGAQKKLGDTESWRPSYKQALARITSMQEEQAKAQRELEAIMAREPEA